VTSPAELKPRIGKYELLEEVGHGGMATVYRARDPRLGRDVAVKVIHRHLRESKEVAARFVSEARAVAKLRHPNIVEVFDVSGEDDEERFLVVELVRGTTLRKLIHDRGPFPAEVAVAVTIEVASALAHAHDQGVIHRDVKPENVLVQLPSGAPSSRDSSERALDATGPHIKITDFGIAKLLDAQGVTSTGQVLGSPAHMAPEQIEGGEVTVRADVFGLGVLLYECMVGKLPFDGKNPAQVLRRVLDGVYAPADRARPTVGARWSAIVARSLERESDKRYASVNEFADALRSELHLIGFDNPRRELGEYLEDSNTYEEAYVSRIVRRLVEVGRKAKSTRDAPLAAACFNRALAFRPDDAELLAQVAGLARMERVKRAGARILAIGTTSALLGGMAYGIVRTARRSHSSSPDPSRGQRGKASLSPEHRREPQVSNSAPGTAPLPLQSATLQAVPEHGARDVHRAGRSANGTGAAKKSGTVRVVISGAAGKVRIDDGPPQEWLGTTFQLPVGPHHFDFVPPNSSCCKPPKAVTYEVKDQPGVQAVYGEIAFKDAVLEAAGAPGTEVECGDLFNGKLIAPAQRQIPMNQARLTRTCTVFPPPGSDGQPKAIDVTLTPGGTFPISEP
jgi:eukaryotic-like serine/threonine-protein kinase